jgi:hypothetical protein
MRCNLKDGRLVKENEPFETGEEEAEILVRGGIAAPRTYDVPLKMRNDQVSVEAPNEEKPETSQEPVQEDPPVQKEDKRRKKA